MHGICGTHLLCFIRLWGRGARGEQAEVASAAPDDMRILQQPFSSSHFLYNAYWAGVPSNGMAVGERAVLAHVLVVDLQVL